MLSAKQRSAPVGEESRGGRTHIPVGEEEVAKKKIQPTHSAIKTTTTIAVKSSSRSSNDNRSQSPSIGRRSNVSPVPVTSASHRTTNFASITEYAAKSRLVQYFLAARDACSFQWG